jgi:antitoxin PrlF
MAKPTGTRIAEQLLLRPEGASMQEIIAATGGPQYNILTRLEGRGWRVRKVKQGRSTRYFVERPATPRVTATVTNKGQVTLPREVRERLGVPQGGPITFALEEGQAVVVTPADLSVRRLKGILGRPRHSLTIGDMDDVIRREVAKKAR